MGFLQRPCQCLGNTCMKEHHKISTIWKRDGCLIYAPKEPLFLLGGYFPEVSFQHNLRIQEVLPQASANTMLPNRILDFNGKTFESKEHKHLHIRPIIIKHDSVTLNFDQNWLWLSVDTWMCAPNTKQRNQGLYFYAPEHHGTFFIYKVTKLLRLDLHTSSWPEMQYQMPVQ